MATPRERPLSPHLLIYRPQITSALSITHRFAGVALSFGALVLTYWLTSAAYGPGAFAHAQSFLGSWFGRLVLFGLTFSLFFHLCNGVRHRAWDVGWGFEMSQLRTTGWLVVAASLLLTFASWFVAYVVAAGT